MKRIREAVGNPQGETEHSYCQKISKKATVLWPVDRWDSELAKHQTLLDAADEYRILRVPLMGQHVSVDGASSSGKLCGPTAASMVYNFWQLCQNQDAPEDHYIRMTKEGGWNLRDSDDKIIPFANLATVQRSKQGMVYQDANFGAPPSILVVQDEKWVQGKCKLIVDSLKFKCPVVLYSRLSVTTAQQHIVTVAGYAKFAGELWLLILDPESLEIGKRLNSGMFKLGQPGDKPKRSDLATLNKTSNTIRILEGDWNLGLGAIYFLKASHLFASHCTATGAYNYQNKDAGKVGRYFHHGHKEPPVSVPNDLVVTSEAPQVTVPVPAWSLGDLSQLIGSLLDGNPPSPKSPTAPKPSSKPSEPAPSLAQILKKGMECAKQIRAYVQNHIDDSLADVKSSRMAIQPYQGLFPIGMQGSWHGGIHLATGKGGSIHCCRDGVIVAARLPAKDTTKPNHGSRNFVLVRHETQEGTPYWSLYMHLFPMPLSESDTNLQLAMPWLFHLTLKKIETGDTCLRAKPGKSAPQIRLVELGESFLVLGHETVDGRTWYQVQSPKDKAEGWIAKTERVQYATGIPELQQLLNGEVVALNRPVKCATMLGSVDPGCVSGNTPYFHWEIFSKDVLPGDWQEACDKETVGRQWLNDPELLRKILNRNKMGTYTEPLTRESILHTCIEPLDANGKILRGCACKFVSEWAIDWSKAADEAKLDATEKAMVTKEFQPYSFWQDAIKAGVKDLPADGKVWHYHPREALNRLHPVVVGPKEKTVAELAQALKTSWLDPQGNSYKDQNAYDTLIHLAATNHGMSPILLKSLVAQESKFTAKASNEVGFAGLTQLGLREAQSLGLNTGKTEKIDGKWVYDPADERFDAAKALNAGARYYMQGRDSVEKSILSGFGGADPEGELDKFALAVYNLGIGTITKAHKLAREAGNEDALWEDLTENGEESFLCQGMPESFNKKAKHKEGTEFVAHVLNRLRS